MRIAILGWGSLVWNPRDLAFRKRWYRGGPIIPIEFSRISQDGRLTLVIDPENGASVSVRFAYSSCDSVEAAISNLNEREGRPGSEMIGFVDLSEGGNTSAYALQAHPDACEAIRLWALDRNVDAVIWTALPPNFAERRKQLRRKLAPEKASFSPQNAVLLLQEQLDALNYIRNAPKEIQTPAREAWIAALAQQRRRGR